MTVAVVETDRPKPAATNRYVHYNMCVVHVRIYFHDKYNNILINTYLYDIIMDGLPTVQRIYDIPNNNNN